MYVTFGFEICDCSSLATPGEPTDTLEELQDEPAGEGARGAPGPEPPAAGALASLALGSWNPFATLPSCSWMVSKLGMCCCRPWLQLRYGGAPWWLRAWMYTWFEGTPGAGGPCRYVIECAGRGVGSLAPPTGADDDCWRPTPRQPTSTVLDFLMGGRLGLGGRPLTGSGDGEWRAPAGEGEPPRHGDADRRPLRGDDGGDGRAGRRSQLRLRASQMTPAGGAWYT